MGDEAGKQAVLMPQAPSVVSAEPENGSEMHQPASGNLYCLFSTFTYLQTRASERSLKNLAEEMDPKISQKAQTRLVVCEAQNASIFLNAVWIVNSWELGLWFMQFTFYSQC